MWATFRECLKRVTRKPPSNMSKRPKQSRGRKQKAKGRGKPSPSVSRSKAVRVIKAAYEHISGERLKRVADFTEKVRRGMAESLRREGLDVDPRRLSLSGYGVERAEGRRKQAFSQDASGRWHSHATGKFVKAAYVEGYFKRMRTMSGPRLIAKAAGLSYREAKGFLAEYYEALDQLLRPEEYAVAA